MNLETDISILNCGPYDTVSSLLGGSAAILNISAPLLNKAHGANYV